MESRDFVPLERRAGHPYIKFRGQVTMKDMGSPDPSSREIEGGRSE
jgi:hypothetical protein